MKKKSLVKVVASLAVFSFVLATVGGQAAWAGETILKGDAEVTNAQGFTEVRSTDDKAPGDYKADIGVNAKILEYGDVVYKIDISWGTMEFQYKNKTKQWDPENHVYVDNQGEVTGVWLEEHIDGTNNKITVVNHSNAQVNATFTYAHVDNEGKSLFNANPSEANAVRGHFFLDNTAAQTAATVLKNSANVVSGLTSSLTLGHQDALNAEGYGGTDSSKGAVAITEGDEGSCKRYVYFTFNGTPDDNLTGDVLTTFATAGTITVTITPTP